MNTGMPVRAKTASRVSSGAGPIADRADGTPVAFFLDHCLECALAKGESDNDKLWIEPAREMHAHRYDRPVEDPSWVSSDVCVVRPDHHLAPRALILQDPADVLGHRAVTDHVPGLFVVTGSTLLTDLAQRADMLARETPLLGCRSGDIGSLLRSQVLRQFPRGRVEFVCLGQVGVSRGIPCSNGTIRGAIFSGKCRIYLRQVALDRSGCKRRELRVETAERDFRLVCARACCTVASTGSDRAPLRCSTARNAARPRPWPDHLARAGHSH